MCKSFCKLFCYLQKSTMERNYLQCLWRNYYYFLADLYFNINFNILQMVSLLPQLLSDRLFKLPCNKCL